MNKMVGEMKNGRTERQKWVTLQVNTVQVEGGEEEERG